jgi:hypothetical protein
MNGAGLPGVFFGGEMQMRKILIACALLAASLPSAAAPVYMITDMQCAQVRATIEAEGAVILRWRSKSGMALYDRYVSDRRFCRPGEIVSFASVPAAGKACTVKKCVWRIRDSR